MKAVLVMICAVAFGIQPAKAQSVPDAGVALQKYYGDYLSKKSWGQATDATKFKSFYLGQRLTVGERTPFLLCKPTKDINGENICTSADFKRFVCPFTPPIVTCTGFNMSSNSFSPNDRDPALTSVLTAFGNEVRPSIQIALDDWFSNNARRGVGGRVIGITINAKSASPSFVQTAVEHFTRATGQPPNISLDEKDKAIISRQCKANIDRLFAGRAKMTAEVRAALAKCETDSLSKFLISTTRSTYYLWNASAPTLPQNKAISMGVHSDLTGSRAVIEFSYKPDEAEREFSAKIDALSAAAKAAKAKRTERDF